MPAPPADAPPSRRHIVQCARAIGPGFGVSGPSLQLERAFVELGCTCERFTLDDLHVRADAGPSASRFAALCRFWYGIVVFSTIGSVALWWKFRPARRRPGTVVVCQVDALYGDIFVIRSLHKGFLERHPSRTWMLLRNPLHALVLARDAIRFRGAVHKHFVALSQSNKNEVVRLYGMAPERITVIPNGVDLDRFRPSPAAREEIRRTLGLADDDLVAIFVGHELERKGLRVLLEALRFLNQDGVSIRLIVASGESPDRLRQEFPDLEGLVFFVGHRQDIERFYAAADVFAMPASYDISPLVGPEALASGLPLVMTDVGDVREYLRDGGNGLLVARDAESIAHALSRLASDRALLRRLSESARASVADRDWRVIGRRLLDLMDRLLPLPDPKSAA